MHNVRKLTQPRTCNEPGDLLAMLLSVTFLEHKIRSEIYKHKIIEHKMQIKKL